ncbi:MAG TPA: protein kinase, partial [Gemmataceae bacterium]|nr:protein kinase [Gemmataceae bacterium]
MSESSSEVNPLDVLAEEFVARHRAGERPSLDEFTARCPDLADDIRDLFPGLVMMEGVRPDQGDSTGPFAGGPAPTLKRLGDFRILREVGRGGMGVVYEAEQESLGRHVALKVLPAHALMEPQRLRRFQREAKAAARLHHTNIVPVHGVGEQDGLHYYVMQFIQGQGLDQVLAELQEIRRKRQGSAAGAAKHGAAESAALSLLTGKFASSAAPSSGEPGASAPGESTAPAAPPESSGRSDTGRAYWGGVARIGIQTAQALAYAAAQGTLHRDVKPSNLLLDAHGNLWVTDFGLAKAADSEDLTHTGDIVGTLRYMAPERFSGKGDLRSDLYSLGLTLYELLALRPAFAAPDRQQLVHQVLHADPPRLRQLDRSMPRDLETIVHKAIDRDPARRYQTAEQMADDLQRFLDDRPIRARRVGAAEKLWRWARRNPTVAGLSAALALVLCGVALVADWDAYEYRETAQHEAKLAADERKAHADADAARKEADDNAGRLRDRMAALYEVNALMASARQLQAVGNMKEAHADLTTAVERMPEYALVWRERAELYYHLGLGEEALADLTRMFNLREPEEPELWLRFAGLRLQQGDAKGYRAVCSRMEQRFLHGDKEDPIWLSLACCLGPDAVPSLDAQARRLEEVIKASGQSFPWTTTGVLAMVQYRAGRFDEAERRLKELGDPAAWKDNGGASLFLLIGALIQHHKGKDDKTSVVLLQSAEDRLQRIHDGAAPGLQNDMWSEMEREEGQSLYREAAAAIRGAERAEPPGLWGQLAWADMIIGRKERAIADLTQELDHTPDDPAALLVTRAHLYADIGQRDQCNADIARFVAMKRPDANHWLGAFNVLAGVEDWDAAADLACRALEVLQGEQAAQFRAFLPNDPLALSRVAQRRPDDFVLRLDCARVCRTVMSDRERAVQWATEALRIRPDDPDMLRDRGTWNAELGRLQDAAADFGRLLRVEPEKSSGDLLLLALLRAATDDRDGYVDVCRELVKRFGDHTDIASLQVGEALTLAPNDIAAPKDTLQRFETRRQYDLPDPFGSSAIYWWACVRAGQEKKVVENVAGEQLLGRVDQPALSLALALAYHRLGRMDDARAALEQADRTIEQQTGGPPWETLEDLPVKLGNSRPADAALRILLLRREAEAAINAPHRRQAEQCLRNKQWKEAVGHLDALLKTDPTFWPDLLARSTAYAALGEQEKAEADFLAARALHPADLYFHWRQGDLDALAERWDQADDDYAAAIARGPWKDPFPLKTELCADFARYETVTERLLRIEKSSRDVSLLVGLAQGLQSAGKLKEARTLLDRAVELTPDDGALVLQRGRLAAEQEQWAVAAADLSRVYQWPEKGAPDALNRALAGYESALAYLAAGDLD